MKKTTAAAALFLALSSMTMAAAHADVIYAFSGTDYYSGTKLTETNPFATATFKTGTDANTVNLTLTVLNGVFTGADAGAYVNDWAFNLVSNAKITSVSPFTSGSPTEINKVGNFFSLKDFELALHFDTSSPGQIGVGGSQSFVITGTAAGSNVFNENSFFTSDAGIYSAVHVQGYKNGSGVFVSSDSVKPAGDPLPEPATVALLGLGLLGFAASRRKSTKSKNA